MNLIPTSSLEASPQNSTNNNPFYLSYLSTPSISSHLLNLPASSGHANINFNNTNLNFDENSLAISAFNSFTNETYNTSSLDLIPTQIVHTQDNELNSTAGFE